MSIFFGTVSIISLLLSSLISCVALNVSQQYRIYFLLPIVIPAAISFFSINYINVLLPGFGMGSFWGHAGTIHVANMTSVLYLEQWVLHPTSNPRQWDFHAAYKIWSNPRLLHTPRAVPGSPIVHSRPSRKKFILRRLSELLVLYLIAQYIAVPLLPGAFAPLTLSDFSAHKQSYFRRLFLESDTAPITTRETLLRSVFAVHWIWANFAAMHIAQTAAAILFSCILRWDEPWEWRPLFGNPLEAYTLRRFWSRFWQRLVYMPYKNYGLFIARRVLRLQEGSIWEKVVVLTSVFLLSGTVHSLVAWQNGRCEFWRDTAWFLMNSIAATVETVVENCWKAYTGKRKGLLEWDRIMNRWGAYKVIGFVWILGFFFWSVPKWEYGKIYCAAASS